MNSNDTLIMQPQETGPLYNYVKQSINYLVQHADYSINDAISRDISESIIYGIVAIVNRNQTTVVRINARSKLIKKALRAIRDMDAKDLCISNLLKYLNVSLRALQLGFDQVLGISPKKYLVIERLNRIRVRLLSKREKETIASIARAHGVVHLGNFSRSYFELFGEYPSQTFRHSPMHSMVLGHKRDDLDQ